MAHNHSVSPCDYPFAVPGVKDLVYVYSSEFRGGWNFPSWYPVTVAGKWPNDTQVWTLRSSDIPAEENLSAFVAFQVDCIKNQGRIFYLSATTGDAETLSSHLLGMLLQFYPSCVWDTTLESRDRQETFDKHGFSCVSVSSDQLFTYLHKGQSVTA
jgi:hypothetical protein